MEESHLIQDGKNNKGIKELMDAFASRVNYKTRLQLYQRAFPLPTSCFTPFDPALSFLFHKNILQTDYKWQQTEKQLAARLRQTVVIGEKRIVLDITPRNSQRSVFNAFVIDLFRSCDGCFASLLAALQSFASWEGRSIPELYEESNAVLRRIQDAMNDRKSIRLEDQMTRVFYLGYADGTGGVKKQFPYKRKFIELYLYAQGQMFAEYRRLLSAKLQATATAQADFIFSPGGGPDWKAQLQLLQKTGIVDLLESRFAQSETSNINLLDTTLCFIIGQHQKMSAAIRSYLDSIRLQRR
ncbi:MAG: hypothetical protein KGO82_12925 [Bacteroidota bacterium]|nr:hypothetical protein [Bacteroidota bacterium]